jgi:hypothetical protein
MQPRRRWRREIQSEENRRQDIRVLVQTRQAASGHQDEIATTFNRANVCARADGRGRHLVAETEMTCRGMPRDNCSGRPSREDIQTDNPLQPQTRCKHEAMPRDNCTLGHTRQRNCSWSAVDELLNIRIR